MNLKQKLNQLTSSKKAMAVLSFLGLYLLSAGISLAIFSYASGPSYIDTQDARARIASLPKTEECPTNGQLYSKVERDIWETRRPIAAIVENHVDSRPPSGLSRADVVYEAVAEGGITRFLSVFYCGAAAGDVRIGPIRSVRVYFIDWASEYSENPLFVHSGGANSICGDCPGGVKPRGTVAKEVDAFNLLASLDWRAGQAGNALDAGTNIGFPAVWRDYERIPGAASEHTFMGSTDKLFEEGIKRDFGFKGPDRDSWEESFTSWKFADDSPQSPTATKIFFEFWANKSDYNVEWRYDQANNRYLRFNGGKEHLDMDTKEQLAAKNVVVQFVDEEGPVDKEGHMFYTTVGEGDALIFQNGVAIEGTWEKDAREERTIFFDNKGKEITFVRGTVWIEAVPAGNDIDY